MFLSYVHMCVSVYENVHMWAQESMGPEESLDHLQLEFQAVWSTIMDAMNWTQIPLWEQ